MFQYKISGTDWSFLDLPNECPLCHHAMVPHVLAGAVQKVTGMGRAEVELVFQCPQDECRHAFIGRYDGDYDRNVNRHTLILRATTPVNVVLPDQPEEVAKLSPQFVAIYGEAAVAEARGLPQIAGCGYRKALEFLVKDFCIMEKPSETEAIKAEFLGTVIEKRIDHPKIRAVAKLAAWLGNDETHYVRIWVDRDIKDLKQLIALTVSWMRTHLLTRDYEQTMPDPPKKGR